MPSQKRNRRAKQPPNKLLITAANDVLCDSYAAKLENSQRFEWSADVISEMEAKYASLGGQGGLDQLSEKSWRNSRTRSARDRLKIGIVQKQSSGGDIGEQSYQSAISKLSKGAQNAIDGLGPLERIQLPADMIGRVVEFAEARRLNGSTPIPSDLEQIFPVGDELAAAVGAKGDLDGVWSIVAAVFTTEMNMTADMIDGMKHDDIDQFVDEFIAKKFGDLDTNSKEYKEEAGIQKYVLHMVKCRLTSVQEMLLEGKACLLPVKIEDGSLTFSFTAVFTVVRRRRCSLS